MFVLLRDNLRSSCQRGKTLVFSCMFKIFSFLAKGSTRWIIAMVVLSSSFLLVVGLFEECVLYVCSIVSIDFLGDFSVAFCGCLWSFVIVVSCLCFCC